MFKHLALIVAVLAASLLAEAKAQCGSCSGGVVLTSSVLFAPAPVFVGTPGVFGNSVFVGTPGFGGVAVGVGGVGVFGGRDVLIRRGLFGGTRIRIRR
jgi:hypothetical protein